MPNPTQADLHINVPLTNVSVAYMMSSDMFMSTKVFPRVPVTKQSDLYWKYSKSDWRRTDVQKRAPGTESPGIGWKVDTGQYFAHVYAVHKDVDDQTRSNADSYWQLDKDSTLFVTNQLMLKRDIDWNDAYFKTGVWATDLDGTSQFDPWDDVASDPIVQFENLRTEYIKQAGVKPNILVLGAKAITALKNHPDLIDRIKYTQKGVVTEDLLASLLGVDRILVSYASKTDVLEQGDAREQDADATYNFISNENSALLVYAPQAPSLMTPAAGYTFTWNGYLGGNRYGIRMKNFRMEHIASDRIEGEMTYDMRVVSPDMGVFLHHVANNP
jgi:hypothetical protein